jgi:uncharacterized protein (DUF1330 family)
MGITAKFEEMLSKPVPIRFFNESKEHTRNKTELDTYAKQHDTFIAGHALTYRARFGRCEVVEGSQTEGVAILEFPTFELAKAWYESPAYQQASKHRFQGGDYRAIIVE